MRLSIARSLALALLGLTLVLAALAGIGVASLYSTRQRYDDRLTTAYALETASAKLLAASVVEEATLRPTRGASGGADRRRAERAFSAALTQARNLASDDPTSERLVDQVASDEAALRRAPVAAGTPLAARTATAALASRQQSRRDAARRSARSGSRRALIAIAASGGLALVGALGVLWLLIVHMRGPLTELVGASRRLASGDLSARVQPSGPAELRSLGGTFNSMADDLSDALARLESERQRLAQTIESLGDALLVVDADGTVAAANPRARELLPELAPGARLSDNAGVLPPEADALGREVTLERSGLVLAAPRWSRAPARPAASYGRSAT